MTNLQDALFPPIDEEESIQEQQVYSLLDSIKSDPQPADALTAALLIQQEIDRWKLSIQELENRIGAQGAAQQAAAAAKETQQFIPVVLDEDDGSANDNDEMENVEMDSIIDGDSEFDEETAIIK